MTATTIPKIISVFHATQNDDNNAVQSNLLRSSYIVHNDKTLKLSTILADLRIIFKLASLSASGTQMILMDMNGIRVRSASELYAMSPTTFLLTTSEERDEALKCFAKLCQPRGTSAKPGGSTGRRPPSIWHVGSSKLMMPGDKPVDKPSPIDKIQEKRRQTRLAVKTRAITTSAAPRVANVQTAAQRNRIQERIDTAQAKAEQKSGIKKKSRTKRRSHRSKKVVEPPEETTEEEPVVVALEKPMKPPPTAVSQIEAQKIRVETCQDRMAAGVSFMDKMGKQDLPTARRFKRSPIDSESTPKLSTPDDIFADPSPQPPVDLTSTATPVVDRVHRADDAVRVRDVDGTLNNAMWTVTIAEEQQPGGVHKDNQVVEPDPDSNIRPGTVTLHKKRTPAANLPVVQPLN